jgi:hypothetical protein
MLLGGDFEMEQAVRRKGCLYALIGPRLRERRVEQTKRSEQ